MLQKQEIKSQRESAPKLHTLITETLCTMHILPTFAIPSLVHVFPFQESGKSNKKK